MAQLLPEPLKVSDQIVEAVWNRCYRALAVTAKVITDAGEVLLEFRDDSIPGDSTTTYSVNHVQRWPVAGDRVRHIYGTHGVALIRLRFLAECWLAGRTVSQWLVTGVDKTIV